MFHEQTRGVILSQDVDMSVSYHYRSALKHVFQRRTVCMAISKNRLYASVKQDKHSD